MREPITDEVMPDIRPLLIKAIKDRPGLWNVNHPQFKMKLQHAELWNEVVAELPTSPSINVETVKKQWKNMKDTYRKELKRPFQQWCYCNEMSFMKNILINGRRLTSPSKWIHNDLELKSQEVHETANQEGNNEQVFYQRDYADPFGWIQKRSNSFTESDQVVVQEPGVVIQNLQEDENIMQSQMSEPDKSEDYHFLMSILPEMEKLSPMQKMRLRTKINAALFEEMCVNYSGTGRVEQGASTSAKQKRKRSIS